MTILCEEYTANRKIFNNLPQLDAADFCCFFRYQPLMVLL